MLSSSASLEWWPLCQVKLLETLIGFERNHKISFINQYLISQKLVALGRAFDIEHEHEVQH